MIQHEEKMQKIKAQWRKNNKERTKNYHKLNYIHKKETINEKNKKYLNTMIAFNHNKFQELGQYQEIRQDPDNPELGQVQCVKCNKWINPTYSQVTLRISCINNFNTGDCYIYCSEECKDSCPIYKRQIYPKGYKTASNRPNITEEVILMALQRDNYTCQKCKNQNNLEVHHIAPATQCYIMSDDLSNLITLCHNCHKQIHQKEGCKYHQLTLDYIKD